MVRHVSGLCVVHGLDTVVAFIDYLQQGCAYDISVHVKNHIRQTNKCALRRWQRRWLGLSVHFNQPLLYPVG